MEKIVNARGLNWNSETWFWGQNRNSRDLGVELQN